MKAPSTSVVASLCTSSSAQHVRAERTVSVPHLDEPVTHLEPRTIRQNYIEQLDLRQLKPDIKMGVGGITGQLKSTGTVVGPPKPPRVMEHERGTHSLDRHLEGRSAGDQRKMLEENKMTYSLDRGHSEKKWDQEQPEWTHRDR